MSTPELNVQKRPLASLADRRDAWLGLGGCRPQHEYITQRRRRIGVISPVVQKTSPRCLSKAQQMDRAHSLRYITNESSPFHAVQTILASRRRSTGSTINLGLSSAMMFMQPEMQPRQPRPVAIYLLSRGGRHGTTAISAQVSQPCALGNKKTT